MERRSFLRRAVRAPCFQGVDLRAQPFLTKRGRATRQIAKRVFVVLDGGYRSGRMEATDKARVPWS